jgi:benzoyl-CoA-dihydrodiol lyase
VERQRIDFQRQPEEYRHWRLSVDGRIATLTLNVAEDGGLVPGYQLKLNSYDLGVDIELHDALQRIRFEHPQVASVILTSGKDRMFCAGANIYMLGASSHQWKVNFCKFTNETRNGIEDSSRHDGLKFIAAVNGTCAGGGYEVALACDEILMVDDRSTVVSLPEVPLLGVLPGTGGLTRVVDKRKVRRDLADVFCTSADGVKAERAKSWGLVDDIASPNRFPELVKARAEALVGNTRRPESARGIVLTPLARRFQANGVDYDHLQIEIDRPSRTAALTINAPSAPQPSTSAEIEALGDAWWPLAMARELDDAILHLRTNEPELGLWLLKTAGEISDVLDCDKTLHALSDHWLVRETIGLLRRTLARLEVSSRSLFAVIDQGSCFAGLLFELALAADRIYMLDAGEGPEIALGECNFGMLPGVTGRARLAGRWPHDETVSANLKNKAGMKLDARTAMALGLITFAPDELDWEDELRLAIEERAALSPDALTGLEANLRFAGAETMTTKIFSRLSAWQNWVFYRPNSTGERGALKLFGTGSKPNFDWERV